MFPLSSNRFAAALFASSVIADSYCAHAAPGYVTLYSFKGGNDGAGPASVLIADKHGDLYGTTQQIGGTSNLGTIYKVAPGGSESVLHIFSGGTDGAEPDEGLLRDQHGDLYGGTSGRGRTGLGTLYKLTPRDDLKVLYDFPKKLRVNSPNGDLIEDSAGNLFGTAGGGTDTMGVIFEFALDRTFTVLHNFQGADGSGPFSGLVTDSSGTMYGTTMEGGTSNIGVLYAFSASGGYHVLHNFAGFPNDGANPADVPVLDSGGAFYGVTESGGTQGLGVVYKLLPGGHESILHNFVGGNDDGSEPAGRLLLDSNGNLFGVTSQGGTSNLGTVFELAPHGKFTILHSFSGDPDGSIPVAGLLADAHGNYYGTTLEGGAAGLGTVFKIHP